MSPLMLILGILVILVSLIIIVAIVLQPGRRAGINGVISGGADTFLSKNKARTFDGLLARLTSVFAVLFIVTSFVLSLILK